MAVAIAAMRGDRDLPGTAPCHHLRTQSIHSKKQNKWRAHYALCRMNWTNRSKYKTTSYSGARIASGVECNDRIPVQAGAWSFTTHKPIAAFLTLHITTFTTKHGRP